MERLRELVIAVLSAPITKDDGCSCGCNKCGEQIPGGLAQNMTPQEVAQKHNVDLESLLDSLKQGTRVELEHTPSPKVAAEIALDHLFEDPNYYDKLKDIENA